MSKPLNPREHPAGTRLLHKRREWSDAYESTVLEWAPSGKHVKLRHALSGHELWEEPPYVVEVLPAVPREKVKERQ